MYVNRSLFKNVKFWSAKAEIEDFVNTKNFCLKDFIVFESLMMISYHILMRLLYL
jgi:hypothetical protein